MLKENKFFMKKLLKQFESRKDLEYHIDVAGMFVVSIMKNEEWFVNIYRGQVKKFAEDIMEYFNIPKHIKKPLPCRTCGDKREIPCPDCKGE